jgi:TRAP-type mannitol/chloroaromatic compound transport system permease small subunit
MQKLVSFLDGINEGVGKLFSWSTTFMVWIIFALVVMRYGFGMFSQKASELSTYFFAISFLMASGYTFKNEKHVRVDLFYAKWSDKRKAWVNLIGSTLFLMPWCVVSIIVCFKYAKTSFLRGEVSAEPSGLPVIWILKFILVFGFILLFIQGLSAIAKSLNVIRGVDNYNTSKPAGLASEKIEGKKEDGTWEL